MIEVLVSSKLLAAKLSEIDFSFDGVDSVSINGNTLTINTRTKTIDIECAAIRKLIDDCPQQGRRWDWVEDTVKAVSDQPIILKIDIKVINVIFQY